MKTSALLTLLTVLLVAAAALYFSRNSSSGTVASSDPASSATAPSDVPTGQENPEPAITLGGGAVPSGDAGESNAPKHASADEVWKERLQGLLTNDTLSDRELGKELLNIVAEERAPESIRVRAMANSLNFVDDENYAEDVKPFAIRQDLPETVNDVILEDLINRDPVKILPTAREFVAVGNHPLSGAIDEFVKSFEAPEEE
jgi:hypothetical protein